MVIKKYKVQFEVDGISFGSAEEFKEAFSSIFPYYHEVEVKEIKCDKVTIKK